MGGIIGTVVGILLAPKPGSETRADLVEQSETMRERAEELAARVRERVGPAVEGMRDRVAATPSTEPGVGKVKAGTDGISEVDD